MRPAALLLCALTLLAACGSADEPDPGSLAKSVQQGVDQADPAVNDATGEGAQTKGAECRRDAERTWICQVKWRDLLARYQVAVDSEGCWRGRLTGSAEAAVQTIPAQVRIEPYKPPASIRGCL
jgi:hypothetical protein